MSDVLRFERGCRPGSRAAENTNSSGREAVRLANLQRYMLRAQAGLPIFDDTGASRTAMAAKTISV